MKKETTLNNWQKKIPSFAAAKPVDSVADTNLLNRVNSVLSLIILSHGIESFQIRQYYLSL